MKAPYADELILGFEHELLSDLSIGMNATYRKLKDFTAFRPEKTQGSGDFYTSADYQQKTALLALNCTGLSGCTKVPFLPNGQTQVSVPYYTLKSGVAAPTYFVITNVDDYSQTYKGLELNATKRMSNRWMLRGNVSYNDWTQDVGPGAIWDPTHQRGTPNSAAPNVGTLSGCTVCNGQVVQGSGSGSGAKGGVYINSKWAYNLTGVYQIPVIETSFGFNVTGREGYPVPYIDRISTSEGRKYVLTDDQTDTYRLDNVMELDLRLAKDIRFQRLGITFSADMFNVLNDSTVLQRVTRLNTSTANHITEIQSPRVIRLGARLTF